MIRAMGSLSRQASIYSLTLNEVENHLGEPLQSMNLDELLRNVLPVNGVDGASGHYGSGPGMSKKTVNDVWRDIQQVQRKNNGNWGSGHERQSTLGEMTLEDFLMKAGMVDEGTYKRMNNSVGNVIQAQETMMGVYPQTPRQKRAAPEIIEEKGVERRQKRMIKNRESAARSRARKQAYMNELENKISRLEEENERLKKQKELDAAICCIPLPELKHPLRRSSSSPF